MSALEALVRRLEHLVREGKGAACREELTRLGPKQLARASRARLAQLAWRSGDPELGLKWLAPVVRPAAKRLETPSDAERAEYAQCLTRLGAAAEAGRLLATVDVEAYPRGWLYRAAVPISRADYGSALPELLRYVRASRRGSYEHVTARINVAAALVAEGRYPESTALLRDLLHETSSRRLGLLHGNALEISAQSLLGRRRWAEAERCLTQAAEALRTAGGVDAHYVDKWTAILRVLRSPESREARAELASARSAAEARGQWETIRHLDRVQALVDVDRRSLAHLYFGTPYPAYRARLLEELGLGADALPAAYSWLLGPAGRGKPARLDVTEGATGTGARLPAGQLPHRCLLVLASDFYRPFRVGTLFGELFPEEVYNLNTSAKRVHNAVAALRRWLEDERFPLGVEETEGQYRLVASARCELVLRLPAAGRDRYGLFLDRLRERWPAESFSLAQAQEHLGVSPRTTNRVLDQGRQEGLVTRSKGRAGARYAFTAPSTGTGTT